MILQHSIEHVSIVHTRNTYFVMHWSMLFIGSIWSIFFICLISFFSVRHLSVLRGHSFFSSPPQRPMTSDCEGVSGQCSNTISVCNLWKVDTCVLKINK